MIGNWVHEGLENVLPKVNQVSWVLEFQCLCNLGVGFACGILEVVVDLVI